MVRQAVSTSLPVSIRIQTDRLPPDVWGIKQLDEAPYGPRCLANMPGGAVPAPVALFLWLLQTRLRLEVGLLIGG